MGSTKTVVKTKERSKKRTKVEVAKPEEESAVELSPKPTSPQEEGAEESLESDTDVKSNKKKRKRVTAPEDELEIDVSLPEPLSKKASRKAKKSKTSTTSDSVDASKTDSATKDGAEKAAMAGNEKRERRTAWGIWIGNMPWTKTKQDLIDFLCGTGTIKSTEITRVHMPAPPDSAQPKHGGPRNHNKGFGYVDFDSPEALEEAMKFTETAMDSTHRKVLIKNANSYEGRPEPALVTGEGKPANKDKMNNQKPPSKRIFVGNLGFDITKDDLSIHFGQCGSVSDVHMATFEDTGKCKGFAWVTFDSVEAGTAAVRGWILKSSADDSSDEEEMEEVATSDDEDNEDVADAIKTSSKKSKKVSKPRKWFVNRLQGRMLRCEFAEDASVRYKKRFGKDAPKKDGEATGETEGEEAPAASTGRPRMTSTPHDRRRDARRAARADIKVDARTIAPGAALAHAPRASAAIVEGKGKKISFD
jgi:RNA recognition motif-containing protein